MSDKIKRPRGRPPVDGEPLVQTAFRLPQRQIDWLDTEAERLALKGRNALLRRLIEKAMPKKR